MLIKIDHIVSNLLAEDRADLVRQLTASKRMYAWVEGENIGKTIDQFALNNRRATFGDFIEWTKKTYMDRLEAQQKDGTSTFSKWKMEGDYNPTKGKNEDQEFGRHGEAVKGVDVINDAVPARRKELKKVAEPGKEAEVDAADQKALEAEGYPDAEHKRKAAVDKAEMAADETIENPKAPPSLSASGRDFPGIEPGQKPDNPDTPLAKRGLGK